LKFGGYLIDVTSNFAVPELKQIFKGGGGLFTKRTVRQWLFNTTDPLLARLRPQNPICFLVKNDTSEQQVLQDRIPSTYYTGKNDIDKIAAYIAWNGAKIVTGIWLDNMTVNGTNEEGQFQPLLDLNTNLYSFNEEYAREIELIPVARLNHKGITTQRYEVSNTTLVYNPFFYQTIQGFSNQSSLQHAPIYQSNPHFFGASPYWQNQLIGMKSPDPSTDITFIDVEPITGKVLNVRKMLQVNIYVPPNSLQFLFFNPNVRKGLFYPIMWAVESSLLTDAQAAEIKDKIYLAQYISYYSLPVLISLGIVLLVCPMVYLGIYFKVMRKQDVGAYQAIQ